MLRYRPAILTLAAVLGACSSDRNLPPPQHVASSARPLKLASWNLEFLAEKDSAGCAPRASVDYAGMRAIADGLDADVIAFQEAESIKAAERVFDPARYIVVMETRAGNPTGTCGGDHPKQRFIRQAVGFAVRKGIAFERHPDVVSLTLGNPQLRSGVDITLRLAGSPPLRLMSVHLKSGCFSGAAGSACPTLLAQVPALEQWIDAAAAGPVRYAVLGDWDRRLGLTGDQVWTEIDDASPANADLRLADAGVGPACDPRYDSFIDHIVLDRRAGAAMLKFSEVRYPPGAKHFSDHCPITVTLSR